MKKIPKKKTNQAIVNASIDFDVIGFDDNDNILIKGNLKDMRKDGTISQLITIKDKKTGKLITSFIFHVVDGHCVISHKGDYVFENKDAMYI